MIADSSRPNKLRNVYEERHHPKTVNLLYKNHSHRAYHKLLSLKESNPFAIERCKSEKGASVSVVLTLFNSKIIFWMS